MKAEDEKKTESTGVKGESTSTPESSVDETTDQQEPPQHESAAGDASERQEIENGDASDPIMGTPEAQPGDESISEEEGAERPPESETERLSRELEEAMQLAAENYEKFLRFQAEMENYKKRAQKERIDEARFAHLPVMRDLMGILDNLERAVEHARSEPGAGVDAIVSGVELVAKQLTETFERHGMKRIKSVGEQFDPTMHEAMAMVESDDVPENQVMEEFEAGYFLHDRVVKPAKVTVSKKPA